MAYGDDWRFVRWFNWIRIYPSSVNERISRIKKNKEKKVDCLKKKWNFKHILTSLLMLFWSKAVTAAAWSLLSHMFALLSAGKRKKNQITFSFNWESQASISLSVSVSCDFSTANWTELLSLLLVSSLLCCSFLFLQLIFLFYFLQVFTLLFVSSDIPYNAFS